MHLTINGLNKKVSSTEVSGLLNELDLEKDKVVIEINRKIVDRENYDKKILNDNDIVEIVTLVGGG